MIHCYILASFLKVARADDDGLVDVLQVPVVSEIPTKAVLQAQHTPQQEAGNHHYNALE